MKILSLLGILFLSNVTWGSACDDLQGRWISETPYSRISNIEFKYSAEAKTMTIVYNQGVNPERVWTEHYMINPRDNVGDGDNTGHLYHAACEPNILAIERMFWPTVPLTIFYTKYRLNGDILELREKFNADGSENAIRFVRTINSFQKN